MTRAVPVAASIVAGLAVYAAMAISVSPPAVGQSDETCVAYMEADVAYEPHRREYQSALAAADRTSASFKAAMDALTYAKAAHEVALRNSADPRYANLPDLRDHKRAKRRVEIARSEYDAASAASSKALDTLGTVAASTEPARKKRARAYQTAYKGPRSFVGCGSEWCGPDSVLAKLIKADRERCRQRLELYPQKGPPDGTREARDD